MILRTNRLILRPWQESDFEPFAKLTGDPRVMEFFPATLSREESDRLASRIKEMIEERGWGLWAAALHSGEFIGFIGLNALDSSFAAPFTPAVEVGWRLAYEYWGKGYAPEGARECLRFGFENLQLPEIVSIAVLENRRSISVMEKIGMHRDPEGDFDHPKIPEGSRLRRHLLYRLRREEWS